MTSIHTFICRITQSHNENLDNIHACGVLQDPGKIHPVICTDLTYPRRSRCTQSFEVGKLCRATDISPLEGQIADPPPPIEFNDHDEWEGERIVAIRIRRKQL
jgi:hypothetical protein